MMFLGDHWIGMEPFMDEFKTIGLDAVVGSVGNGATLRLISDIEGVNRQKENFDILFADIPRRRRSGERSKSQLGDCKTLPEKADRSYRIRRIFEWCDFCVLLIM